MCATYSVSSAKAWGRIIQIHEKMGSKSNLVEMLLLRVSTARNFPIILIYKRLNDIGASQVAQW